MVHNANLIENYPGFPNGLTGERMVSLLQSHIKACGVKIRFEQVTLLDYLQSKFLVRTDVSEQCYSRVIIASGTVPIESNLPGIADLVGKRVFYEVKDLRGVTGKHVGIIGAGDAAFDYALNLATHNTVTIYNKNDHISCLPLLWGRASRNSDIKYKPNFRLVEVELAGKRLSTKWDKSGGIVSGQVDYLLIAIGRRPNLDFASSTLMDQMEQLEEQGRIIKVGDVKNGLYRQIGISIGDGIRAAMTFARHIRCEV